MDILEIIKTIKEDWALLVFFFAMGGAWWQGKAWFKKLDDTLSMATGQHGDQSRSIDNINLKLDSIGTRITNLEMITAKMHDDLQDTEVRLAVLQNTRDINESKEVRRQTRRKSG